MISNREMRKQVKAALNRLAVLEKVADEARRHLKNLRAVCAHTKVKNHAPHGDRLCLTCGLWF